MKWPQHWGHHFLACGVFQMQIKRMLMAICLFRIMSCSIFSFWTTQPCDVDKKLFQYLDVDDESRVLDMTERRVVLMFLFGDVCTSCSKNVPMWNRMTGLLNPTCDVAFGVAIVHSGMNPADSGMKFLVVRSLAASEFKKAYELRDGVDYTLVFMQGRLVHSFLGMLTVDDYLRVREVVNGCAIGWES